MSAKTAVWVSLGCPYWPSPFGVARGAVPYLEVIRRILTGLPDFHLEVAESAANGEFHFVRWIANGVGAEGFIRVYGRRPVALAPHRLDQGATSANGSIASA